MCKSDAIGTREQFQNQLQEINSDIIKLANATGQALLESIDALYNQDKILARQVITNDRKIDRKEVYINDKTILLIAKQQPVATDLRRLIIALKVVTDIERMGDNAKNIAISTIHLDNHEQAVPKGLKTMRDLTLDMLHTAINAFQYEDITIAGKLSKMEDHVDHLYKMIISELLGVTANNPDKIQYIMEISFCARYIERFADHITNIGESILYLVRGENYKLN